MTAVLCAAWFAGPAHGQAPLPASAQFNRAQQTVAKADEAVAQRDMASAVEFYQAALADYLRLSRHYPDWEPGMTRFRINYCKDQLRNLMAGKAVAPSPAPTVLAAPPATPSSSTDAAWVRARASILLADQRPEEARRLLIDSLKTYPDDAAIRLLLGVVRCEEGDYVDAMYILESVTTDAPRSDAACVALAGAYFGLGQIEDARSQLARALALNPRSADAHYNLARVLLAADKPDAEGADAAYRRSLELGGTADPHLENEISEAAARAASGGWRRFVPFLRKRSAESPEAESAAATTNAPAAF